MVQRRAAGVGTYWPDAAWPSEKVREELQELDEAASHDHRIEEYADLLFAMVNLGRHLAVDAESALRHANAKFNRRFQAMETLGGDGFADLSLEEKDRSEEHTSELQSLMRISFAVFCLIKKKNTRKPTH